MAHVRFSLLLVVFAVLAMAACAAPAAETPTPTRTREPVATVTQPPPVTEDDWSRVQEAGVITVASPLDNAPFNMYDADRKPDGFDIALMRDLARRLGLKVEFVDVPFEGLLSYLRLGEADAAIAAMAITPERLESVDFSQTYYVGEDGILAAPDSDISAVETKADVVDRQVGVVRGTVYESWLRKNLIETKEMPERNLHVYLRPDDAVRELDEGRIDLVVLDREPALTYAAQGLAKLVGKSKFTQMFAIPVRKGSTLLSHLNEALAAAIADRTVAKLTEQYLNISEDEQVPIPTPTPQPAEVPTATPTPAGPPPPVACDNATGFDKGTVDQSIPDGSPMLPGQPFEKRWRIINVGTCDWTAGYSFVYANKGERMRGNDAPIGQAVPKGSSVDVSVAMVAPNDPGKHFGYWQVTDANGKSFGKQVYVEIMVLAPSPTPTQTPPANVRWGVDKDHIKQGESATFTWNVTGAKNVYFNERGQPYIGVQAQSSQKVSPTRDTTYQLHVEWSGGGFYDDYRTIYVAQAVPPPVIARFDIYPQYETVVGQTVTLSWVVQGNVQQIAVLRDGSEKFTTTAVDSSWQDVPPVAGDWKYELQARGPGGSAVPAHQQISVKQSAPPPPSIPWFTSNPQGSVLEGDCVDLSWDVQGEVQGLEVRYNGDQPGGNLLPVQSPGGRNYHDCECPSRNANVGNCLYALHAWGPGGDSGVTTLTITVAPKTIPGNPCTKYCTDQGGQPSTARRGDGQEYAVCDFGENGQCEQCAMMYGTCPTGGIRAVGYPSPAAFYCAVMGKQYNFEQDTCNVDGQECAAEAYYNGQCP